MHCCREALWQLGIVQISVCIVQGCKAVICMPTSTPGIKIDAVRRLGGSVELVGETYSETQTYAQVPHLASCTSPSPVYIMRSDPILMLQKDIVEKDCKAGSLMSCARLEDVHHQRRSLLV